MKRTIFFVLLLFLLVGAVAASEDINNTDTADTLSAEPTQEISVADEPASTLSIKEDVKLEADESSAPAKETPTVTTSAVSGTQGKYITLKAIVKTSSGPVSGAKVTFNLNGQTYTAYTDANGVATKSVKCPSSAVFKTTSKTKGKILTKTTTYSKTYTCTATVDGNDKINSASSSFSVVSKKAKVVKKYKIIKKKKIITIPVKNGLKTYKKGQYGFVIKQISYGTLKYFALAGVGKKEGYIKFFVKDHVKKNGKWSWDSWYKVPKGKLYEYTYPNTMKVDKLKIKYTQVSQKRIK